MYTIRRQFCWDLAYDAYKPFVRYGCYILLGNCERHEILHGRYKDRDFSRTGVFIDKKHNAWSVSASSGFSTNEITYCTRVRHENRTAEFSCVAVIMHVRTTSRSTSFENAWNQFHRRRFELKKPALSVACPKKEYRNFVWYIMTLTYRLSGLGPYCLIVQRRCFARNCLRLIINFYFFAGDTDTWLYYFHIS